MQRPVLGRELRVAQWQVERMMPGGLMVMGLFLFCPAEQVASGASKLGVVSSILRKLARSQRPADHLDGGEVRHRSLDSHPPCPRLPRACGDRDMASTSA